MKKHRGGSPEDYSAEMWAYYGKGVVNKGESYLYLDTLKKWCDFADIIPELQTYEEYHGLDFDNFAVKAYLDYEDPSEAEMTELSDIGFSAPATRFNVRIIVTEFLAVIAAIALVILFIRHIIMNARRKKTIKIMKNQLEEANKTILELGGETLEIYDPKVEKKRRKADKKAAKMGNVEK